MSLKTELADAVDEIFSEFDDIAKGGILMVFVSEMPQAGGGLSSVFSETRTRFIYSDVSYSEKLSGDVTNDDIFIMIKAADFPIRPLLIDKFKIGTTECDILSIKADPSMSLYTIQLRA